jgi:hypothetical protein
MSALGVAVIGILLGALLSNGSGTPTSAPQTAPCQLLTRGEAETLLGFPVTNVNALGALKLPDGAHMCAYGPGTGSHVQAGSAQALWITTKSGSAPVVVVPSLKSARGVVDGAKTTWQWDAKIAEGFMSSAKDGVAFWVTVGGQGMSAAVGEKIAEQAVGLVLSSLT